jgi:hypothetical protein
MHYKMANPCTLSITPFLYALPPPTFWILWILAGPLGGSLYVFPTDSTTICESLLDIYLEFLNSFKLILRHFSNRGFQIIQILGRQINFCTKCHTTPNFGFLIVTINIRSTYVGAYRNVRANFRERLCKKSNLRKNQNFYSKKLALTFYSPPFFNFNLCQPIWEISGIGPVLLPENLRTCFEPSV